jgi:hypothetical protein
LPSNLDNNPDLSNLNSEEALWLNHETSLSNSDRAKRITALRGLAVKVEPRGLTDTAKRGTV